MDRTTIGWTRVFALGLLAACGGGGGDGTGIGAVDERAAGVAAETCANREPLPPELQAVYEEVEACTGLVAPPPSIVYSPTVACPTSGNACCLADVEFTQCSYDASKMCGANGRFLSGCDTIELPDLCDAAAKHEMIHHLLRANGRSDWEQHTGPEWQCQ